MKNQDGLLDRELVSALMDGQLRGSEFARVVESLPGSSDAMDAWHAYHVVGDVLRSADLATGRDDRSFVSRWRERLDADSAQEHHQASRASLLEPQALQATPDSFVSVRRRSGVQPLGANDSDMRWKVLAAVASVAAVATIGWHLASVDAQLGWSGRLATAPSGTPAFTQAPAAAAAPPTEAAVMLRDARLDELLAAHKQFGGTSALQTPAGFLRNATFENPGR